MNIYTNKIKNKSEETINLNTKFIYSKYNKIKPKEIKIICKKMSILLGSGHEITYIINILADQSNKKISKVFTKISNHIQKGNSITQSFKNTNLFSKFFISMLMAGEVSGNLENVMEDLSEYYDREEKLKSKIMTVSIYPIILIVLSILTLIFMLMFVIPNFQMVFVNNNINPPILTRILIELSMFLRKYYLIIFIGLLGLLIVLYFFMKTSKKVKYFKDYIKLKCPFIKDIVQLVITTRFCRTLGILLQSGVNIIDAIDISSKVVDNEIIYKKLAVTKEYVKKGNNISHSIEKVKIFPKTFISMIKVGEESGNLDSALSTTHKFYSEELNLRIEQIIKFMEPAITIILGIIIGIFVIAMVMPIFDAVNSI